MLVAHAAYPAGRIAFCRGDPAGPNEIWEGPDDASEPPVRLTTGWSAQPTYRIDAGKIAYSFSTDSWSWRTWTMNPDGSGKVQVPLNRVNGPHAWIGLGRLLIGADHYDWDLYETDMNGSYLEPIRPRPGFSDLGTRGGDVSLDGSRIAHGIAINGGPGGYELYAGPLYDQSGDVVIYPRNGRRQYDRPMFSPDGSWIAFVDCKGDYGVPPFSPVDIYKVRPDGSELTLLVSDVHNGSAWIDWSPDG